MRFEVPDGYHSLAQDYGGAGIRCLIRADSPAEVRVRADEIPGWLQSQNRDFLGPEDLKNPQEEVLRRLTGRL